MPSGTESRLKFNTNKEFFNIDIVNKLTTGGHWVPQCLQIGMFHTLTYTSKLTERGGYERNFTTKEMFSINFPIVNFPFICSNIPAAPAYGVYISQLIRYSRDGGSDQDFLDRGLLLTRKLLNQGFLLVKLKSSLRKLYGCHQDLDYRFGISVSQMTTDVFHLS